MIHITHLPYKKFLLKNDCYFLFTFRVLSSYLANLGLSYSLPPKCTILTQIWSKLSICPKRDFGKIDYYYCIPTVFFDATTFKKSPQRANNKTEGCIILPETRCEFLPQTRIFWKSWPLLFWSSFCIQSCHDISQNSSRV